MAGLDVCIRIALPTPASAERERLPEGCEPGQTGRKIDAGMRSINDIP